MEMPPNSRAWACVGFENDAATERHGASRALTNWKIIHDNCLKIHPGGWWDLKASVDICGGFEVRFLGGTCLAVRSCVNKCLRDGETPTSSSGCNIFAQLRCRITNGPGAISGLV